jgi:hypothetical protein
MTLEEQLKIKKEKLEKILAERLNKLEKERRWLKETEALKEGDEDYEWKEQDIKTWKRAIERDELITEALQMEIDQIDSELRNSGILREPEELDLRKLLKVKNVKTAVPAIEDLPGYEEHRKRAIN